MNRLGQAILGLILLAVIGFASMLSFDPQPPRAVQPPRAAPPPAPAAPPPGRAGGKLAIPVAGVAAGGLVDTWGQSRAGGARAHQAIDIAARRGTPVIAAAPGVVEKMFRSDAGGITLYVRSPDRGWSYYYAHLAGYAPGLREGSVVRTGALLGYVGDTGNAGAGNTHLHFAVSRMRPGDRWWQGEPVNPYPLLAGAPAAR